MARRLHPIPLGGGGGWSLENIGKPVEPIPVRAHSELVHRVHVQRACALTLVVLREMDLVVCRVEVATSLFTFHRRGGLPACAWEPDDELDRMGIVMPAATAISVTIENPTDRDLDSSGALYALVDDGQAPRPGESPFGLSSIGLDAETARRLLRRRDDDN